MQLCSQEITQKLLRVLGGLVTLIALVHYIQTIDYGFVLDDHPIIIENTVTKNGIRSIPTIFTTSHLFGYPLQDDEVYRPIPKAFFAILWSLAPDNPLPGHLLNILLYGLTGYLLLMALHRFFPANPCCCLIAALLFIAHPLHTEVVANIKSLDEILSLLFFLASLFPLHRYAKTGRNVWLFALGFCFFSALLSKESAITFLAIYPLLIYFSQERPVAKMLPILGVLLTAALLFLLIRAQIVGIIPQFSMAGNTLLATDDFFTRKATAIYILGLYLKLFLFPHPLTFDYSYNQIPLIGITDWRAIASLLTLSALCAYALARMRQKDLVSFGLLFFLVTISITSNLFLTTGTTMGERLMYTPSLGLCFAFAAGCEKLVLRLHLSRATVPTAILGTILLLTLKTWSQNAVWKSDYTLYASGVIRSPNSHRTHFYLGYLLQQESFYRNYPESEKKAIMQRGVAELERSLAIYPDGIDTLLQLGHYYLSQGQHDIALSYLTRARELSPDQASIHNQIGAVYFEQKEIEKAIEAFTEAIRLDPDYLPAHKNLGSAYGTLGKFQLALNAFANALRLDPNDADCYYYLGVVYGYLGDKESEKKYRERAATLDPKYR